MEVENGGRRLKNQRAEWKTENCQNLEGQNWNLETYEVKDSIATKPCSAKV